jgi:serine/threonine protein kinase
MIVYRERIQGDSYSYPSDIWSFGLTMLAVAKGRFPLEDSEEPADGTAANASIQSIIKAQSNKHIQRGEEKWTTETNNNLITFNNNLSVQNTNQNGARQFHGGEMEGTGGYWGMIRAICELSPPTPGPTFSEEFNHFINVCLRKDPEERYTARALLFDSFACKELEDELNYNTNGGGGNGEDYNSESGSPDQGSRKRFSRPSSGKPGYDESPFSQSVKMSLEKRGSRDREATLHQAAEVYSASHSTAASPALRNPSSAAISTYSDKNLHGELHVPSNNHNNINSTNHNSHDSNGSGPGNGNANGLQSGEFDIFNPETLTVIDAIRLKHLEHIIIKLIAREKQLQEELNNPNSMYNIGATGAGGADDKNKPIMRVDSINSYAESMDDDISADDLFWKSAIDVGGMNSPAKFSNRHGNDKGSGNNSSRVVLKALSSASNDEADQSSTYGVIMNSFSSNLGMINAARPPNISPAASRDITQVRDPLNNTNRSQGLASNSQDDEGSLTEEQLRARFQGIHQFAPNASFQRITSRTIPAPPASMPMCDFQEDIHKWDYLADQLHLPINVVRIVADAKIREMREQSKVFYSREPGAKS